MQGTVTRIKPRPLIITRVWYSKNSWFYSEIEIRKTGHTCQQNDNHSHERARWDQPFICCAHQTQLTMGTVQDNCVSENLRKRRAYTNVLYLLWTVHRDLYKWEWPTRCAKSVHLVGHSHIYKCAFTEPAARIRPGIKQWAQAEIWAHQFVHINTSCRQEQLNETLLSLSNTNLWNLN